MKLLGCLAAVCICVHYSELLPGLIFILYIFYSAGVFDCRSLIKCCGLGCECAEKCHRYTAVAKYSQLYFSKAHAKTDCTCEDFISNNGMIKEENPGINMAVFYRSRF